MFGGFGNNGYAVTGVEIHPVVLQWSATTGVNRRDILITLNRLVNRLIKSGLWFDIAMIRPYIAGNSFINSFNLVDVNTNRATFSGDITHDITKVNFSPNVLNGFANHNIIVSQSVGENFGITQFISNRITQPTGARYYFGATSVGAGSIRFHLQDFNIIIYGAHDNQSDAIGSAQTNIPDNTTITIQRESSNIKRMYRNGVLIQNSSASIVTPTVGLPLFEGALNNVGNQSFFGQFSSGFFCVHKNLTPAQIIDFNSIIHDFIEDKNKLLQ